MKKPILIFYLLTLIGLFFPTSMGAQTPTTDNIVLSDLDWDDEEDSYYFTVSLEGSRIYTAFNLDITLPQGINVRYSEEDDEYMVYLVDTNFYPWSSKKGFKHQLSPNVFTDTNMLRIACNSSNNDEFLSTSGGLCDVYVELDASKFTFSPKPIVTVSGIGLVVKEGAQKYVPADFSCRPFVTGIPTARTLPLNISSTNKIGTLILPFNAALPKGMKAYTCDEVDETALTLTLTPASSIESCKPYIVYSPSGYSGNISGTVNLSATYPDEDIYTEGYLTGVLSPTVVNTGYIMQNQGDGPMFYDAEGENFSLPAGRCYFTPSPSASLANVMGFRFVDAETTHISGVENGKATSNTFYHDLAGRRVMQPTKGIYIQDRKKVLIK